MLNDKISIYCFITVCTSIFCCCQKSPKTSAASCT